MPDILVYIEMADGQPTAASRELIAGARALADGGTCTGVAVGEVKPDEVAGLDNLLLLEASGMELQYTSERHAAALGAAAAQVPNDLVLVANSYIGLDQASSVAAMTDRPLISYCRQLRLENGMLHATCLTYGGKAEAQMEADLPAVAAVNPGAFPIDETLATVPAVTRQPLPATKGRMSVKSQETAAAGINIADAERLVCVGRGIGEEDNIQLAIELAGIIGAELVATRPVVDLGWVEKSRQVGKSGRTVKPKLYIALGVSGAPEHLEGMRDAEFIIAVNTDAAAPIFDVAHVGTTCDLLELLPALVEKLGEGRA